MENKKDFKKSNGCTIKETNDISKRKIIKYKMRGKETKRKRENEEKR